MKRAASTKALVVIAVVVVLFLALRLLPVGIWLQTFVGWVSNTGVWGLSLFALTYVLAAVLLLPGSVLTLGAGALFGVLWGTVAVSVGSTLGAGAAFLIGRYLARERVATWATHRPKFAALDRAVGREGGRIVLLTRLSPLFPYNLLNYLFGLTRVGFWPYLLASWVGMLPATVLYVYIGFAGRAAVQATSDPQTQSAGKLILGGIGLSATLLLTYFLTRIARKALEEKTT